MAIYATVIGNLGADCKQVTLGQTPALQFNVAATRSRKDKNGQKVTEWVSVTYFTTQAAPYLLKGRKVAVTGELEANAWMGTSGQPNAGLQMIARSIEFVGGQEEAQAAQQPYQQAQPMQAAPQPQPQYVPPQPGGDMPF
jgi:single stranded DNA-binding protein